MLPLHRCGELGGGIELDFYQNTESGFAVDVNHHFVQASQLESVFDRDVESQHATIAVEFHGVALISLMR
jgi:hypothetical protein